MTAAEAKALTVASATQAVDDIISDWVTDFKETTEAQIKAACRLGLYQAVVIYPMRPSDFRTMLFNKLGSNPVNKIATRVSAFFTNLGYTCNVSRGDNPNDMKIVLDWSM